MTKICFKQEQFPVGQGGFHMGSLKVFDGTDSLQFVWAYDCGSDQRSVLEREIKSVEGSRVDLLFLSHLDDDHVAGVDKFLLTTDRVQEVVLPYLNDKEMILHLAAGASSGSLSRGFIDLVSDPVVWFRARGVERLTYIDGYDEEGEESDGPDDPIEPTESDTGGLKGKTALAHKWSKKKYPCTSSGATRVQNGAIASINYGIVPLNWVLSPFVFRPSSVKLQDFYRKLDKKFGKDWTLQPWAEWADTVRTKEGREKLRNCYDAVWKTHNLHSMALYAGPASAQSQALRCTVWQGNFLRRIVQPGWLSTGDFDFSVKKRRQKFLSYYSGYAEMTGQLTLSHHGSDHSFHAAVLSKFPNLTFAIAAVGTNSHGHPGRVVQTKVCETPGLSFVRVDEARSSHYKVCGLVSEIPDNFFNRQYR